MKKSDNFADKHRVLLNKNKLRVNKKFDGKGVQILSATGGWFELGQS